jgi:hypothetical protein
MWNPSCLRGTNSKRRWGVVLLALLAAAPLWAGDRFTIADLTGERVVVMEYGRPVLVYNYGPQLKAGLPNDQKRCCYIHPLYTPAGVIVTDDFPEDHVYHRGMFWAWPVVETAGATFDLWTLRGVSHHFERWVEQSSGEQEAALTFEQSWQAGGKKIVLERVVITVRPSSQGTSEFSVSLTLNALRETVTLRGSQDQKGSGGFSAHLAPRTGTVIRTDQGTVAGDEDRATHQWAELSGIFNGHQATLRITPDPANPGVPNQWCLRQYGMVGVSYPGAASLRLEPGAPLTLKYRVTLRDIP